MPAARVVDLLQEAPDFNPHAGAHLISAFSSQFPPGTVFLCVVDPGVGTDRDGVVVTAGGHWFVGPDNGLLSLVSARKARSLLTDGYQANGAEPWKLPWVDDLPEIPTHFAQGPAGFMPYARDPRTLARPHV